MLIFRCQHLGELLSPLPGAGLSERCLSCLSSEATVRLTGGCLPCETSGGTAAVMAASSPALESAPAVTTKLPVRRGLDAPGRGLTYSARTRLQVSSLSWALLPPPVPGGRPDPGLCPQHPGLLGLRCWNCAPAAQPPPWSLRLSLPSCSWATGRAAAL